MRKLLQNGNFQNGATFVNENSVSSCYLWKRNRPLTANNVTVTIPRVSKRRHRSNSLDSHITDESSSSSSGNDIDIDIDNHNDDDSDDVDNNSNNSHSNRIDEYLTPSTCIDKYIGTRYSSSVLYSATTDSSNETKTVSINYYTFTSHYHYIIVSFSSFYPFV